MTAKKAVPAKKKIVPAESVIGWLMSLTGKERAYAEAMQASGVVYAAAHTEQEAAEDEAMGIHPDAAGANRGAPLSRDETDVLTRLSHGKTQMTAAGERGVALSTVKAQVGHILFKLHAANVAHAVWLGLSRHLIKPEDPEQKDGHDDALRRVRDPGAPRPD